MAQILRTSLLVALCALPLGAIPLPIDLEQIPVERLVANLGALAEQRPNDVTTQLNLGRAHSMAYASKSDIITAARVRPRGGRPVTGDSGPWPWFGHDAANVPYRVQPTTDPVKQAAAVAHLKSATRHFRRALEIDPGNPIAQINLGWVLEQAGNKAEAIAAYRDVVAKSLPLDGRRELASYVGAEAVGYLTALLDAERDAAEIASLRQRREKLLSMPRPVTPIAVPLRDQLHLSDVVDENAAVRFDADRTGIRRSWTWITPDAAWLVYDQKGRDEIGSALQLFGNVTFWMFWDNGYDAMRALDDNGDGRLAGGELRHLHLWRDDNSNGVSERREVQSLAAYDVVSLGLDYARLDDADQTPFVLKGVSFRDGSTRPTWDVVLQPAR
jgi:hypothetical protein